MRRLPATVRVLAAGLVLASAGAGSEPAGDLDGDLADALREAVRAARGFAYDDRLTAETDLSAAAAMAADAETRALALAPPVVSGRTRKRILARVALLRDRLDEAAAAVSDAGLGSSVAAAALEEAARAGARARRALRVGLYREFDLRIRGAGFAEAGERVVVRIRGSIPVAPAITVVNDGPGLAFETAPEVLSPRRFRLRAGPDLGGATLTVDSGTTTRTVRLFNLGPEGALSPLPPWGGSGAAPATLTYPAASISRRVGTAQTPFAATVTGGNPAEFDFSVDPPLPAGLSVDPSTGALSGTPTAAAIEADYTFTVSNLHGSAQATVRIETTPPLPAGMEMLADGFAAERLLDGLSVPVKMALAPDGRLFFNELTTGNVRIVSAAGSLVPDPFASVAVETGGERGLLGLALAPDFATSGNLFVYAIAPAAGMQPFRGQVVRFTAVGDTGTAPLVILDDLPAGFVQNGGDLQFAADGKLFVSVGDTGDSALPQTDGSRAGRVLRYDEAGNVPAGNPIAGDPEWCRGLRNPFDLAVHAGTGGLFCTENGPTFGDEVNFLSKGKNYEWETLPPNYPLNFVGHIIIDWTPVIVPTGLAFHSGTGFGAEYADDLFVAAYDDAELRRLVLSGALLADLDLEEDFARWDDFGSVANKPLDVVEAADGSLLVSTFSSIWRIWKYSP